MRPSYRYVALFAALSLALSLRLVDTYAAEFEETIISFEVHPQVSFDECRKIHTDPDHLIFNKLVEENRIVFKSFTYEPDRNYPCYQALHAKFNTRQEFYSHLKLLQDCFSYDFFRSGADYAYHKSLTALVVGREDQVAYDILLRKNSTCVNETTSDSYRQLISKPYNFLTTFGNLSESQKKVVVHTNYRTLISEQVVAGLPNLLKQNASDYNQRARGKGERYEKWCLELKQKYKRTDTEICKVH